MNDKNSLLTIRKLTQNDWIFVKDIYQQGLDLNIATFQTICPSFEEWNNGHLPDCRFVAVYEGEVVGFAVLSPTSKRDVYHGVVEVSIYLDIQHTGQGIGTKLFSYLINAAEEKKYWSLYSSIIEENTASIALHQKCGFRKIGYREKIARDRFGNWHNTLLFERRSSLI
ncbi:MAG: N-acetyltransferase family protein [Velocimicrobium sp.]